MNRRRPFKLITAHRRERDGFCFGVPFFTLYDVLECGHEHPAVFLPKPSRSPYRRLNDKTLLRRCNSCPLEEAS